MLLTWVITIPLVFGLGYLFRITVFKQSYYGNKSITRNEWMVGTLCSILIGVPISTFSTNHWARTNQASFVEFWNGIEMSADKETIKCEKNGRCLQEYNCEPYQVCIPVTTCTSGPNNTTSCTTTIQCHTEYHRCPYCTHEYSYRVTTSIGQYTIDEHRFPLNPDQNRWKNTHDYEKKIPRQVIDNAGVGDPQFWTEVKNRIDRNEPGGATKEMRYVNYVLAAQTSILSAESYSLVNKWDIYIPKFTPEIYNFYQADKIYDASPLAYNRKEWVEYVSKFNAVYGTLQGDLHLIILNAEDKVSPDEYALAVRTAFMDTEKYPEKPLAKNSTLVILSTNGYTVSWARMITGMPKGNESATVAVRDNLEGTIFLPDSVIGKITWKGSVPEFRGGKLVNILLTNSDTKFVRTDMDSFKYLFNEIPVPIGWRFLAALLTAFISLPVFGFMYWFGNVENKNNLYWR